MNKARRLGLISDSHGNFQATEEAISILIDRGCEQVIHLGDFCDTNRRDRLEDIVRLFQKRGIIAIKGNNDYLVELSLSNDSIGNHSDQKWMYEFLKNVPMKVVKDNICFAHSFPFDYLRSFYEPIDVGSTQRAFLLFQQMPYRILFCGHSHTPVYFCCETQILKTKCVEICKSNNPAISGGYNTPPLGSELGASSDSYRNCHEVHTRDLIYPDSVLREITPLGEKVLLQPEGRYIFVVGSADEGECAVFDTEEFTYERINIFS
ncbi:MAG: metallophosphoesterase family protein [Syntrophaceae bacterium]|nr:metallophosphoesterase family protein [Syntrophaceae bacterium]